MIPLTALSVHVLDAYLNNTEEYCEFESRQNGSSQILFAVSIYFLLLKIFFVFVLHTVT